MRSNNEWAIVLAAGDGTRLSLLTEADGKRVPKQFWSMRGSRSLLGDALHRAFEVVSPRRTVVVVASRHRALWHDQLAELPPENVIVQPSNRGTGAGLLLPLLSILKRDPKARVLVLPSDHFVDKEYVLAVSLRLALESLGREARRIVLLGISPTSPEPGYGWIVPRHESGTLDRVEAFVEKPAPEVARAILRRGGLWNSFLMAFQGQTLLELFLERAPVLVDRMSEALEDGTQEALEQVYEGLESTDFSRDMMQVAADRLWLLRVPECGWTDLGTPERVAECVARLGTRVRPPGSRGRGQAGDRLSLVAALRRVGMALEPLERAAGVRVG